MSTAAAKVVLDCGDLLAVTAATELGEKVREAVAASTKLEPTSNSKLVHCRLR